MVPANEVRGHAVAHRAHRVAVLPACARPAPRSPPRELAEGAARGEALEHADHARDRGPWAGTRGRGGHDRPRRRVPRSRSRTPPRSRERSPRPTRGAPLRRAGGAVSDTRSGGTCSHTSRGCSLARSCGEYATATTQKGKGDSQPPLQSPGKDSIPPCPKGRATSNAECWRSPNPVGI